MCSVHTAKWSSERLPLRVHRVLFTLGPLGGNFLLSDSDADLFVFKPWGAQSLLSCTSIKCNSTVKSTLLEVKSKFVREFRNSPPHRFFANRLRSWRVLRLVKHDNYFRKQPSIQLRFMVTSCHLLMCVNKFHVSINECWILFVHFSIGVTFLWNFLLYRLNKPLLLPRWAIELYANRTRFKLLASIVLSLFW